MKKEGDGGEEVLQWVPKKRKLEATGTLVAGRRGGKKIARRDEEDSKDQGVARPTKSLFDEKTEMLLHPESNKQLSKLEEIIQEEKQLLESLESNKELRTVQELAHDVKYTEYMSTDWSPPGYARHMPEEFREKIRKEYHIIVEGEDVPPPLRRFKDFKFPRPITEHLRKKGIKRPTPIQMQGIPAVLAGRDLIGIAFTGSGKCLARDTPVLMHDGGVRLVQDVEEGDLLMGDDSKPRRVLGLTPRGVTERMARIVVKGGDAFECNLSHILSLRFDLADLADCPVVRRNGLGIVTAMRLAAPGSVLGVGEGVLTPSETVDIAVRDVLDPHRVPVEVRARLRAYRCGPLQFAESADPAPVAIPGYAAGYWWAASAAAAAVPQAPCPRAEVRDWFGSRAASLGIEMTGEALRLHRGGALWDAVWAEGAAGARAWRTGCEASRWDFLAGVTDACGHPAEGGASCTLLLGDAARVADVAFVARSLGLRARLEGHGAVVLEGALDRLPCEAVVLRGRGAAVGEPFTVEMLEVDEYFGFTLDGNGRFVLGDSFLVTHNTLVFVLPMVMAALTDEVKLPLVGGEGPVGLCLSPSRELARQTYEVVCEFTGTLKEHGYPKLNTMLCMGGIDMREQYELLRYGVHMAVATPGRLQHMLNEKKFALDACRYFCLDEADRLIDLGFEEEIRNIMNFFTSQRQTLLFSATMPRKIQNFARSALVKPIVVNVGRAGATNLDVIQEVEFVKQEAKIVYLLQCLQKTSPPVLIFAENKSDVDDIHEYLLVKGVEAVAVHGGKFQDEREEAIREFKSGNKDVLVATDVASKGLDFPNIQHVINFDMPKDIENYVHRVGRTGRCGKTGIATTFVNNLCSESTLLDLKQLLVEARQKVPMFLQLEGGDEAALEIDGIRGCAFCGGLGHRIGQCEKLLQQNRSRIGASSRTNDMMVGDGY
mmetsp:Transcript_21135/g.59470  ORF Transcript_21135/g.59470 Transcript_21135/m.59470 type:complete len:941 (-) Transcript_21135:48-2870(-)